MKKHGNRKTLCLAAAAVCLAGSLAVGSALAYFTTYATADGGARVILEPSQTELEEEIYDKTKHIAVRNDGDTDCFVRVQVLTGELYKDILEIHGNGWTRDPEPDEDGFYYYTYKDIVPAGTVTPDELTVEIKISQLESTDDFNVIVVQESTPVLYDENGNPYADWSLVLDTVRNGND